MMLMIFLDRTPESSPLSKENLYSRLFQGECLSTMARFPAASIDMILCDLPYGTTQNPWDSIIPLEALWQQYRRIIKPNGVIALTSQGPFTARLMLSAEDLFKYKMVWVKSKPTNFLNAKKQPLRRHEDICVFYGKQPLYTPQMTPGEPYNKGTRKNQLSGSYGDFKPVEVKSDGGRYPTDVVYFKTAESEGEVFHPTQKPVNLGRWLIKTYTKPGELILDNTFGSGSFLVAAALEGRNWVGIELNSDMKLFKGQNIDLLETAKSRLEKAQQLYMEDKVSSLPDAVEPQKVPETALAQKAKEKFCLNLFKKKSPIFIKFSNVLIQKYR